MHPVLLVQYTFFFSFFNLARLRRAVSFRFLTCSQHTHGCINHLPVRIPRLSLKLSLPRVSNIWVNSEKTVLSIWAI